MKYSHILRNFILFFCLLAVVSLICIRYIIGYIQQVKFGEYLFAKISLENKTYNNFSDKAQLEGEKDLVSKENSPYDTDDAMSPGIKNIHGMIEDEKRTKSLKTHLCNNLNRSLRDVVLIRNEDEMLKCRQQNKSRNEYFERDAENRHIIKDEIIVKSHVVGNNIIKNNLCKDDQKLKEIDNIVVSVTENSLNQVEAVMGEKIYEKNPIKGIHSLENNSKDDKMEKDKEHMKESWFDEVETRLKKDISSGKYIRVKKTVSSRQCINMGNLKEDEIIGNEKNTCDNIIIESKDIVVGDNVFENKKFEQNTMKKTSANQTFNNEKCIDEEKKQKENQKCTGENISSAEKYQSMQCIAEDEKLKSKIVRNKQNDLKNTSEVIVVDCGKEDIREPNMVHVKEVEDNRNYVKETNKDVGNKNDQDVEEGNMIDNQKIKNNQYGMKNMRDGKFLKSGQEDLEDNMVGVTEVQKNPNIMNNTDRKSNKKIGQGNVEEDNMIDAIEEGNNQNSKKNTDGDCLIEVGEKYIEENNMANEKKVEDNLNITKNGVENSFAKWRQEDVEGYYKKNVRKEGCDQKSINSTDGDDVIKNNRDDKEEKIINDEKVKNNQNSVKILTDDSCAFENQEYVLEVTRKEYKEIELQFKNSNDTAALDHKISNTLSDQKNIIKTTDHNAAIENLNSVEKQNELSDIRDEDYIHHEKSFCMIDLKANILYITEFFEKEYPEFKNFINFFLDNYNNTFLILIPIKENLNVIISHKRKEDREPDTRSIKNIIKFYKSQFIDYQKQIESKKNNPNKNSHWIMVSTENVKILLEYFEELTYFFEDVETKGIINFYFNESRKVCLETLSFILEKIIFIDENDNLFQTTTCYFVDLKSFNRTFRVCLPHENYELIRVSISTDERNQGFLFFCDLI